MNGWVSVGLGWRILVISKGGSRPAHQLDGMMAEGAKWEGERPEGGKRGEKDGDRENICQW